MITIKNAQVYSTHGAIAYQIDYSNGTSVRSVESPGQIIRNEFKAGGEWKQAGKSYKVGYSKTRQGERIKVAAVEFCK